jgi:hypothetical protein
LIIITKSCSESEDDDDDDDEDCPGTDDFPIQSTMNHLLVTKENIEVERRQRLKKKEKTFQCKLTSFYDDEKSSDEKEGEEDTLSFNF